MLLVIGLGCLFFGALLGTGWRIMMSEEKRFREFVERVYRLNTAPADGTESLWLTPTESRREMGVECAYKMWEKLAPMSPNPLTAMNIAVDNLSAVLAECSMKKSRFQRCGEARKLLKAYEQFLEDSKQEA